MMNEQFDAANTARCNTPTEDPWQVIHAAMLAEEADEALLMFAGSKETACEVTTIFEEPWRRRTDTGVILYEWADPILIGKSHGLVAPADMDPYQWHLASDGQLRLENGAGVAAEGAVQRVPHRLDYDLPRAVPTDPDNRYTSWVVETPDGRELGTYRDFWDLMSEWNRLNAPCIPSRLTYPNAVGGCHRENGKIHVARRNHSPDLHTAATQFRERFTVESRGLRLPVERLFERFKDWYAPPPYADSVSAAQLGPALLDGVEVVSDDNPRARGSRYLKDRTWLYPTNLYEIGASTPFGRF